MYCVRVAVKAPKLWKRGDIIQYRTNAQGEVDGITLLYDTNAMATEFITEQQT